MQQLSHTPFSYYITRMNALRHFVHGEHITDLNFHCIVVLVHGEHITDLNFHFKLKLVHGEHITDLNYHCKLKLVHGALTSQAK